MPPIRRGFFSQPERPEDEAARQREVEALISTRRTFPQEIGTERIGPNPFQARKEFPDLDALAESIRQQGFTSRLRVRPDPRRPGYFQLVYGERRLRAAQLAGLTEVPCDVAEHSDDELIEIGLAENIQRRDLDPLEEASAFQTFIAGRGYSIRRLAERIGKDKSYIEDRLKLLTAPDDVRQMVAEQNVSLRAAREIAKIDDPAQRANLIRDVAEGRATTQHIREQVRQRTQPADPASPRRSRTEQQVERDAQTIRQILDRWQQLAATSESAHDAISQHAEVMLIKLDQLVRALKA